MKKRRDSVRILFEILLLSEQGTSKTQAVHKANLNFRLIESYLTFLKSHDYLVNDSTGRGQLKLTQKGNHLLALLSDLEKELTGFRDVTCRDEQDTSQDRTVSIVREVSKLKSPKSQRFMQTLNMEMYSELHHIARNMGTSVQELSRAVIIPDWLRERTETQGVVATS